jgi:hypothetical protein
MLTLLDLRLIPGDPARLSFTVGPGSGVRAVGAVLGAASQVAGTGSAGVAMSNVTRQTVVPIPSTRLAEAEQLVLTLTRPLRPTPSPSPAPEIRPISADGPRAASSDRPAASRAVARRRSTARALWIMTASEIVIGLALILLANPPNSDQGATASGYSVLADIIGFVLWIASVPTAIIALIRSLRSR